MTQGQASHAVCSRLKGHERAGPPQAPHRSAQHGGCLVSVLAIGVGPFAVPTHALVLLASGLLASGVGHLAGRRQQVGIGSTLVDMLLAAGLTV